MREKNTQKDRQMKKRRKKLKPRERDGKTRDCENGRLPQKKYQRKVWERGERDCPEREIIGLYYEHFKRFTITGNVCIKPLRPRY